MPNPAKPITRVNRLRAARGQDGFVIDSPMTFQNAADRINFAAHLSGLPDLSDFVTYGQFNASSIPVFDFSHSIDSRLVGKNASTDRAIYSSQTHTGTPAYVRNPTCWAAGIDLTCVSVWNSDGGVEKGGTAISPRHILFAHHFLIANGSTIRFVTSNNVIVERTMTASLQVGSTDLRIGVLDSDLPSTITFARVLPSNWESYRLIDGVAVMVIDKEEKAHVKKINGFGSGTIFFGAGLGSLRSAFDETIISGDSGNPVLLIAGSMPIIVGPVFSANSAHELADSYSAANSVMTALGGGFQLTPLDMSQWMSAHTLSGRRLKVDGVEECRITVDSSLASALNLSNTTGIGLICGGASLGGWFNCGPSASSAGLFNREGAGSIIVLQTDSEDVLTIDHTGAISFVGGGGAATRASMRAAVRDITKNTQTGTAYTLDLTDAEKLVEMNNAASNTLTVPPNSSEAFPAGTQIFLGQYGVGQTTIAAGGGATIHSRGGALKLAGQYATAALIYRGSDEWYLTGDITT